jgi:hypothetical protein
MQKYSKLNAVEEGLELVPASACRHPAIVKVVLTKETKETALGLGWHFTPEGARGGGVKIWKMKEDGIAATAPALRVGMKLLRINETGFQRSKSPNDVVLTIANLEGDVTIVAADDPSAFYSTVCVDEKRTPSLKSSELGIEFASVSKHEIVIKSIHYSSPFEQQWKGEKIIAGDTVLMINDLDCTQGNVTVDDINSKLDDVLLVGSDVTLYFKRDVAPAPRNNNNENHSNEHGSSSRPPPGTRADRVWGSNVYFGEQTAIASCICCLLCGWISSLIVCCNPFDKRRVYTVDRQVYDSRGAVIGMVGRIQVEEGETHGSIDSDRMCVGLTFASMVGFLFAIMYFAAMQLQ